ncbi:MAG TPA: patatin-like phospholipase family protein [Burkholderiaceae bacterium]|nr:patatin-like phospholipase family protein [Burkholderiaceae bacterium]
MRATATTVSLVLGSGGARGLAHIGVIQWLTEHGYEIRSIAGSSIGALVGGIHAARKLEVYAEWVSALERKHVLRLLDPTFGRNGLFKGDRIIGVLRELIGDCAIEDLPLSFTAVAADLETGEEVWLREGRLFDAIRASIATPLVFTPVQRGARTLFDGALVNPLPVAPTLDDATDLTIAVSLNGPPMRRAAPAANSAASHGRGDRRRIRGLVDRLPLKRKPGVRMRGLLDVALTSMQTMHDTIARLNLAGCAPDVTVEIARDACAYHEFWRAQELIALGRERAAQAMANAAARPPGQGEKHVASG